MRNEDLERGTRIRNEERGTKHPMTLYKWCNDTGGTRTRHVCTWGGRVTLYLDVLID